MDPAVLKVKAAVPASSEERHKENASNRVAPAATLPPVVSSVDLLITLTNSQLRDELHKRGITGVRKAATKDELLDRLGVPTKQWKTWRKMKVADLKQELRARGLKLSGTKEVLLQRLGVPLGFGETSCDEFMKKHKQQIAAGLAAKKMKLNPEDDPTHENYTKKCCNNERFPGWRDPTQPAGCIEHRDGSVTEVWRCLNCGKIPEHPNAPPIQEYTEDELAAGYGGYDDGPGECIIS